ncbi:hypothetical protein ACFCYM_11050 [Streptomyces sp. NPDC056254]|uniref:hypothetical protein n=1 Tax=Streptomyces sp. NPDC056254 TaxID=3345763 RepID=UPI0035DA2E22
MKLPVTAVRATHRLDVVRVSAGPERWGEPMTGEVTARWEGAEASGALTLIGKLPTAQQTLCGFAPGWGVRAYGDDQAAPPFFEAAFCYGCDEAWLWGTEVPEGLGRQRFDSGSANAQYLLLRFHEAAGMIGA